MPDNKTLPKPNNQQVATALAGTVNAIATEHHSGSQLTANDILNIAEAIATNADFAIMFNSLIDAINLEIRRDAVLGG